MASHTIRPAKKKPLKKKRSKAAIKMIRAFDNSSKYVIIFKGDIQKKRCGAKAQAERYNKEHFDEAGQVMTLIRALKKGYE